MLLVSHNLLRDCAMSLRSRVAERAEELLTFCREKGYNTHVALFVDLSRHSGRRRFVCGTSSVVSHCFARRSAMVVVAISRIQGRLTPACRTTMARICRVSAVR